MKGTILGADHNLFSWMPLLLNLLCLNRKFSYHVNALASESKTEIKLKSGVLLCKLSTKCQRNVICIWCWGVFSEKDKICRKLHESFHWKWTL